MCHKGLNGETLCQWKVFSIANEDSEQGLFSVNPWIRSVWKRSHTHTHTFHRNVLDGEAEDYGPDHSQGHLSVAIHDLWKKRRAITFRFWDFYTFNRHIRCNSNLSHKAHTDSEQTRIKLSIWLKHERVLAMFAVWLYGQQFCSIMFVKPKILQVYTHFEQKLGWILLT